jgi:hypothetical protein
MDIAVETVGPVPVDRCAPARLGACAERLRARPTRAPGPTGTPRFDQSADPTWVRSRGGKVIQSSDAANAGPCCSLETIDASNHRQPVRKYYAALQTIQAAGELRQRARPSAPMIPLWHQPVPSFAIKWIVQISANTTQRGKQAAPAARDCRRRAVAAVISARRWRNRANLRPVRQSCRSAPAYCRSPRLA